MTGRTVDNGVDTAVAFGTGALPVTIGYRAPGAREPRFDIVGLSEQAAREMKVRVRAAASHLGYMGDTEPTGIITIAPADGGTMPAAGTASLDLAVLMLALGHQPGPDIALVAELSLSAGLREVRGVVGILSHLAGRGAKWAIVAGETGARGLAHVADRTGLDVRHANGAEVVLEYLSGGPDCARIIAEQLRRPDDVSDLPAELRPVLDEVNQPGSVLLVGPPGSGKTMVTRRAGLAVEMDAETADAIMAAYSAAGIAPPPVRPFRAPHHTASEAALVGGAGRPGEATLAHGGVLMLDELSEFRVSAIERLGAVLRAGEVTMRVAGRTTTLPARPAKVVATANPCPCGHLGGHPRGPTCRCRKADIEHYRARLANVAAHLGIERTIEMRDPWRSRLA